MPEQVFKNLSIASPESIDLSRGAWEMFQNPKLLEIYARNYGWEVLEHRGLYLTVKRLPVLGVVRASVHGPEANCGSDWKNLLADLPVGYVSVVTNHRDELTLPPSGWRDDTYCFIMDLRTEPEELFERFQKRTRKAIRSAGRAGMQVQLAKTQQQIDDFYTVVSRGSDNGRRYAVPPLPLLKDLFSAGYGRLYVAKIKGNLVGGLFLLADTYAHGLVAGFDVQAAGGASANLLYYEVMCAEMARGTPFLDFGAQSPHEHPQLTLFKRSFSPALVPAYHYDLYPSRWRSLSYHCWHISRRVRRKG